MKPRKRMKELDKNKEKELKRKYKKELKRFDPI